MQKLYIRLFQTWFKILEIFLPRIAEKWAVNLFFTPLRYPVPAREKAFIDQARAERKYFKIDLHELYNVAYARGHVLNRDFNSTKGKDHFVLYELGDGPPVLLVHGWSGRASQMGTLAEALAESGHKVVTFDAFAHGLSPGKQTTVLEFIKIIKKLSAGYGPFKAMIGHSLGGIACGKAILEGVKTEQLITIGSPSTFQYLLDAFAEIINASKKTTEYIKVFVENYAKAPVDEYSLTNIALRLNVGGMIIHDRDDREAIYDNALLFEENWKNGILITSDGLGHSRILRDRKVIQRIIESVTAAESIAYENAR